MENLKPDFTVIADFYTSHYEEIVAFISSRILNNGEAEDIVQNVFMRLLNTDRMITAITLPNLVYTIARNMIYDYWRHRKSVDEYEHYIACRMLQERNNSMSVYSINEIAELLERGIARLADKQQVIYRMSIYGGLKISEISDTLNINYKSAENRLGLARKEIRRYMARMLA